MISNREMSDYGLPPPVTKLTMEQDLKMRVIEDRIRETYSDRKEDIITVFLALQRQNFVMGNSLKNLIEHIVLK